jgi:enoyl-CoA hydratase
MPEDSNYETVRYESPAPGVARVVMDRPDARNAQNLQMTYDLDAALQRAANDDAVKVIIVAGSDPHFSSGHDLRGDHGKQVEDFPVVGMWRGFQEPGVEGLISRESEIYLRICRRWRDIPKPTIAAVQGKCIAGGLAVAWVCDLIVASDDATFSDPVVDLGISGVEYFGHPWEVGVRKAKEMLFTGEAITADDAHRLGMVNHVVPRDALQERVLELAERIASRPLFALKMSKQAVNQSQDAQGQWQAMEAAFSLHQLCHSHNVQVHKIPVNPAGLLPPKKKAPRASESKG